MTQGSVLCGTSSRRMRSGVKWFNKTAFQSHFFSFQITVKIGTRGFFLRLNKTAREELIGHIFYFLSVVRAVRWAIFLVNYGDPGMRSAVRCCPFVHNDVQLTHQLSMCVYTCMQQSKYVNNSQSTIIELNKSVMMVGLSPKEKTLIKKYNPESCRILKSN